MKCYQDFTIISQCNTVAKLLAVWFTVNYMTLLLFEETADLFF